MPFPSPMHESEVAQSCPTLSDPHGLQPTRLLCPWDFLGKSTGVGCHCLLRKAFLNFIFYWLMEEMVIYFNPANLNTSKFSFPSHPSLHNSFLSSLLYSYLPNLIYLIVIMALQGHSVLQHPNRKSWVHSVYFCLQMIVDGQYTK